MALCHSCGKKLGLLGKVTLISEMRDPERQDAHTALVFCKSCAASWPDNHKQSILNDIMEGAEPIEVFRISEARILDPTGRTGQGLTTHTADYCYGDLVFTDKGICFVGHGAFSQSSSLRFSPTKIAREVAAEGRAGAESRRKSDRSLLANLQSAQRLIFFPRQSLVSIEYSTWKGLKIDGQDRFWSFELPQEKDTYKQFKRAISHYLKGPSSPEQPRREKSASGEESIEVRFGKAIDMFLENGSDSRLKDPVVIESLISALKRDDSFVWDQIDDRELVKLLLVQSTGQNFGDNAGQWQEWWEQRSENMQASFTSSGQKSTTLIDEAGETNKEKSAIICKNCGHSDFEYDQYCNVYTCKECGWIKS